MLSRTKTKTVTATNVVVDTVETYIINQNLLGVIAELDDVLCNLVNMHKDNELALKRVLQCIYRLLHNNDKWNVKFGAKVFHKLIALVIEREGIQSRQLVANVLVCVKLQAQKFPKRDGKFLLDQLWVLSSSSEQQPHAAQILVQLFDDFVREIGLKFACSAQLHTVVKQLLHSKEREERRSAYFIMRKLVLVIGDEANQVYQLVQQTLQQWAWHDHIEYQRNWSDYVTIMENLEEQQSHLVLPTLSTLLPRIVCSNQSDDWIGWLRILYVKLLRDNNNILVLRWTIEYFLAHVTVDDLNRANVLNEFLAATNNTQLYNVEGYFLPEIKTERFLANSNSLILLKALCAVPWRAVPLINWLRTLKKIEAPQIDMELLEGLSRRVFYLQNPELRHYAIKLLSNNFSDFIEKLSIMDYLWFIESLHNVSDADHCDMGDRVASEDFVELMSAYGMRFFFVIMKNVVINENLLKQLSKLSKERHAVWRLIVGFNWMDLEKDVKIACLDFVQNTYGLSLHPEVLQKFTNIKALQQHLRGPLKCESYSEYLYFEARSVDLFVHVNIHTWSDINKLKLNPLKLLDMGTEATFEKLAKLLGKNTERLENPDLLPTFLAFLKKYLKKIHLYSTIEGLLSYGNAHLSIKANEQLVLDILTIDLSNYNLVKYTLTFAKHIPTECYIQGMLHGDATTGDARYEAAYKNTLFENSYEGASARGAFSSMVLNIKKMIEITDKLLTINNELTDKKPRYYENSKQHRIKMRIARSILKITANRRYWSEHLWAAMLALNEQLNVSFMYEYSVALQLPSLEFLVERLQTFSTYKPSQQVSLISVLHIYSMLNWRNLTLAEQESVFLLLLPHTMGANFQTRLLAQLVIHALAIECERFSVNLPLAAQLKTSIVKTLGNKLDHHLGEARLILPQLFVANKYRVDDLILHMTNAPFDEYEKDFTGLDSSEDTKELLIKINEIRKTFEVKARLGTANPVVTSNTTANNANVQRKMNPINDIFPENNLKTATNASSDEKELLVVASLIDKLPNLGGLARTCEVLGVKTLVMDSKANVEKSDFKNLSMTAEKSLNIVEVKPSALTDFLLEKQQAGYKIVGAEQTSQSVSFVNFKFPKKTVLLLGHEKHGIPVDLIGFLDHAVEIPQFGIVRSLNVHVTGSLFIWEYCNQHIV
ncbi:uncharacterized protein LOC115625341 [Scaptodrosophila lebanonensis]|uniref:tRNA (guanosine(18)-2'-O)-methyltransferase TARBP1 n=1 Tax=Drosophila lebanonensis TaxID=7225 RepID=A0A6J2TMH7_DROLE|nr:uncharacterized protein LOC115625341 [Scaptodrosophila lebanonensis]